MPITELVFPSLKSELTLRNAFDEKFPVALQAISTADGVLAPYPGNLLRENGKDVEAERTIVLAVEWQGPEFFEKAIHSEQFAAFRDSVYEFLDAPAVPQLYNAENRSVECLKAPITQIVKVEGGGSEEEPRSVWDKYVEAVKAKTGSDVKSFCGLGMNSVEGVFMGLVGWESVEQLEEVCGSGEVSAALNKLLSLGQSATFVVNF